MRTPFAASQHLLVILVAATSLLVNRVSAIDFAECKQIATELLTTNNTFDGDNGQILIDGFDVAYHGPLRGFRGDIDTRPITLTKDGCNKICGSTPKYYSVTDAFQILTTWIFPTLALMSQLPYESLSYRKIKNAEAFANWIGAPAAALTTTMWNIMMIAMCQSYPYLFHLRDDQDLIKDALYILSCINQYQYPRRKGQQAQDRRRDTALLRGILFSYVKKNSPELSQPMRQRLVHLTKHLAFHLRQYRRKGVYPIYISIIWFGIAFAFSIVIAFATLGDNSTAHSLALGLLLSWVPVVVFASVVDRNPTSDTRCRVLIERWMFNIDVLFEHGVEAWVPWRAPDGTHDGDDTDDFEIGDFMGQGRTLRYCGVTDTVLDKIANRGKAPINLLAFADMADFQRFQKSLTTRPTGWYVIWIISQFVVSTSFGMAFMVSFNTPTVGLGCRSLMYVIWYALTLPSWILLGIQQEPWVSIRKAMMVPNALAVVMIAGIMIVHAIGGLNNCTCKSSVFGPSSYGGYMDFENGQFYQEHYDVRVWWGIGTGVGGAVLVLSLAWLAWKWHKASGLWKVTGDTKLTVSEDMPLEWLT